MDFKSVAIQLAVIVIGGFVAERVNSKYKEWRRLQ